MDASAQLAVAEGLLQARSRKAAVAAPSTMEPAMTVADGFAIQRLQIEKRLADGERIAGWKIGALSAASRALGMTEPFLGPIFDDEINSSGAKLKHSRFFAPGAEPEIAFKVGRRLQGNEVRPEDLPASIEGALAALEIVDCRLVDWFFAAPDIPADCGLTAGAVLSDRIIPISDIVLERETMRWFANEELVVTATGASVGGPPWRSCRGLSPSSGIGAWPSKPATLCLRAPLRHTSSQPRVRRCERNSRTSGQSP